MTSQAFVACSLHERKAETALPPTIEFDVSISIVKIVDLLRGWRRNWQGNGNVLIRAQSFNH